MADLWCVRRGSAKEYADRFNCEWFPEQRPWSVPCDIAIPTATENELGQDGAFSLVENGCRTVVEAANMPCSSEAVHFFQENGVLFGPGKAANAGGVSVSGLEMTQNSMRLNWTKEEVDSRLRLIMKKIHNACLSASEEVNRPGNYVVGANVAGFRKVADAMIEQGLV